MESAFFPHTISIEDDLVFLTVHGEFTLAHLDALNALLAEMLQKNGYLLTLMNVSEAQLLSKEVRKKAAESTRDLLRGSKAHAASAAYGASVLLTGLTSLLFSALRILTNDGHKNTIVRTEAEARAFLSEQRHRFRRELAAATPAR